MRRPDLALFGGLLLPGGLLAIRAGFLRLTRRQRISNTPISKIRSLAVGDVEVEGRARPLEEPPVSP